MFVLTKTAPLALAGTNGIGEASTAATLSMVDGLPPPHGLLLPRPYLVPAITGISPGGPTPPLIRRRGGPPPPRQLDITLVMKQQQTHASITQPGVKAREETVIGGGAALLPLMTWHQIGRPIKAIRMVA